MHTSRSFSKTLSTMIWFMALLLVVFTAGCDRDHGAAAALTGPPVVASVIPPDVSTGMCATNKIAATFSKAMLASTITATGTFTVVETFGSALTGTVTYDTATRVATFTTTSNLIADVNYTATISTAATDLKGTPLAAAKVWSFTPGACVAPVSVNLGLAAPFGIAATAGVTNTATAPNTLIHGDVVLDPLDQCNAVTVDNIGGFGLCGGFPPTIFGTVVTNSYPTPTTSAAVKADLLAAFTSITPLAGPPLAGSLGGATNLPAGTTLGDVFGSALVKEDNWFTPGVYQSLTSILITGDLTLDAQGDPNASFVFQSSSTIDTADGAAGGVPGTFTRILLINGAKASNVWWQAGTSATLGLYSEFQGNILASADITMKTGATSCGRLLAGAFTAGAFVFDANVVSVPGQPFAPPAGYSTVCQ